MQLIKGFMICFLKSSSCLKVYLVHQMKFWVRWSPELTLKNGYKKFIRTVELLKKLMMHLTDYKKNGTNRIKMQETRISLMENFDVEVREKLRDHYERTTIQLNKLERFLWNLSKIEGQREALFDDNSLSLIRDKKKYQLMSKIKKGEDTNNVVHYRLSPPLAEKRVNQAKSRE